MRKEAQSSANPCALFSLVGKGGGYGEEAWSTKRGMEKGLTDGQNLLKRESCACVQSHCVATQYVM